MPKILLVASDAAVVGPLTRLLEARGDQVVTVLGCEEAYLAVLGVWPAYDLIVCDLDLPGMPGRDLLLRVAGQVRERTPVLLLAGRERLLDALGEVGEWAFGVVRKPCDVPDLLANVDRALAHRASVGAGPDAGDDRARIEELERRIRDVARQNVLLFEESRLDLLCGLPNRRRLEEDLGRKYANADRYGAPFALALCDVDAFRLFNEVLGYEGGDRAIRHVARTLTRLTRGGDQVYRYGGDEFVVVMEAQGLAPAVRAADRLRLAVSETDVPEAIRGVVEPITISVGVAAVSPGDPRSVSALVREANRHLVDAKHAGGDCVRPRPDDARADGGGPLHSASTDGYAPR